MCSSNADSEMLIDPVEPESARRNPDRVKPYYAPYCRKFAHLPITHHHRFGVVVGKDCDCPCHLGNEAAPWWAKRG